MFHYHVPTNCYVDGARQMPCTTYNIVSFGMGIHASHDALATQDIIYFVSNVANPLDFVPSLWAICGDHCMCLEFEKSFITTKQASVKDLKKGL